MWLRHIKLLPLNTCTPCNTLALHASLYPSVLSHAELTDNIYISLCRDNFCWAVGNSWQRLFTMLMGGSFNAQSADRYCIWSFHLLKARSRIWGTLSTSHQGYPAWTTPAGGTIALAQFRDNIVVASCGPHATSVVREVCATLTDIWNPPLLCPSMKKPGDPCTKTCMGQSL